VFTLYLAWRQVSFFFILLPILLASGALWWVKLICCLKSTSPFHPRIVGQRWYQQADGRADFNKLLSADNPAVKARHGLCELFKKLSARKLRTQIHTKSLLIPNNLPVLLGGFVLSLLSQWTAPSLASTVTGLIFSLSRSAAVSINFHTTKHLLFVLISAMPPFWLAPFARPSKFTRASS
jgi:hypothetical protein